MSARGSSASLDESGLPLVVALIAAVFLVGHMGLFMMNILDEGVVVGAVVGLALAGYLGYLAADPDQSTYRTNLGILLGVVVPAVLFFVGATGIGLGWLALGGIAISLVVPLVQWCCHSQPLPKGAAPGTPPPHSHPIPGAVVAGLLMFSMPYPSPWAPYLAVGYFGSLLLAMSLGNMLERARTVGRSVTVGSNVLQRWLPVAALMLVLSGSVGIGVPAISHLREREIRPQDGTGLGQIPMRPGGYLNGLPQQGQGDPNLPRPDQTGPPGSQIPQPGQGPPGQPQPQPPPPSPTDYRDLAIRALILILVAAALFWLVKRFGQRILAFLAKTWLLVAGPVQAWLSERRDAARQKAWEARLADQIRRQPDPFGPLPTEPSPEDLQAVYRSLIATAYLLGTEQGESETVPHFVNRLADDYGLDRQALATVAQVCSRAVFAPSPPGPADRQAASAAATLLATRVQNRIPEASLAEKKEAYRRFLAEQAL